MKREAQVQVECSPIPLDRTVRELSCGWTNATLDEIAEINPPATSVATGDETFVSFVPMAAMEELTGRIDTTDWRPFKAVKKGFTRFRDGDVLFAKITPSMENGKIAVARDLHSGIGCGTTEFHVIRPRKGIDANYIRYFVLRDCYRSDAKRNMAGAVGQQRVPADFLRSTEIPVAPANEQARIASKIDELFGRIEAGEVALNRAKALIARYRNSVLKAAVTGELTRDWREKNKGKIEPADKLLERILKARRTAWEKSELAKMQVGVTPRNDQWKERYREPLPPVVSALPQLPRGWIWASVDQLTTVITSGSRDWTKYYGGGPGVFIMAQNVRALRLDLSQQQYVNPPKDDRDRLRSQVSEGDLLITIVGANTGDVCRVRVPLEQHYVCQSVALVRPADRQLSSFLELYLGGEGWGKTQMDSYIYGAGRPHLGFEELKTVAVPIMSSQERDLIVEAASVRLSKLAAVEKTLDGALSEAGILRQSVLRDALEGRLVPQDPTDEPASILLARIRAQRGTPAISETSARRKRRTNSSGAIHAV